jgi:hypothetical protein
MLQLSPSYIQLILFSATNDLPICATNISDLNKLNFSDEENCEVIFHAILLNCYY